MYKNEWADCASRLSTGSQVFNQQAYVVKNGELVKQSPALVRGMIVAEPDQVSMSWGLFKPVTDKIKKG